MKKNFKFSTIKTQIFNS